MKLLMPISVLAILAGCAAQPPQSSAPQQNYSSRCLHSDDCTGRPFPVAAQAWRQVDEGLGTAGGDGK